MMFGAEVHTVSWTVNAVLNNWNQVEAEVLSFAIGDIIAGHLSTV